MIYTDNLGTIMQFIRSSYILLNRYEREGVSVANKKR